MKQIRLVFGRACSGKNYVCNKYTEPFKQVVVSDVVKEISGFKTRSDLSTTKDLVEQIAKKLCDIIEKENFIVINGIRQSKIVEEIKRKFRDDDILLIFVESSDSTRLKRFRARKDTKDDIQTLREVDRLDNELGLQQLIETYSNEFIRIKN